MGLLLRVLFLLSIFSSHSPLWAASRVIKDEGGVCDIPQQPQTTQPNLCGAHKKFPQIMSFGSLANNSKLVDWKAFKKGQPEQAYSFINDGGQLNFRGQATDNSGLLKVERSEVANCYQSLYHATWASFYPERKYSQEPDGIEPKNTPSRKMYPGHWLFVPGATLSEKIDKNTTQLKLSNTKYFHYATRNKDGVETSTTYAMLHYRRDGQHDWEAVEYVRIDGIDTSNNTITVSRNQFADDEFLFTSKDGREWNPSRRGTDVIVAPIKTHWGSDWNVNLSPQSPIYKLKSGWSAWASIFYKHLWKGQLKAIPDGVQFDGARSRVNKVLEISNESKHRTDFPVDIDNDLKPDFGHAGEYGENLYAYGAYKAVEALRNYFSKDACSRGKLIVLESSQPEWGYRGYENLNGIEIENFPENMGGFFDSAATKSWQSRLSHYSSGRQHLQKFINSVDNNGLTPLSYGFTKEATTRYPCIKGNSTSKHWSENNHYFRIGLANAALLGMPHPYASEFRTSDGEECVNFADNSGDQAQSFLGWDEYFGGDLNDPNWLGDPHPNFPKKIRDFSARKDKDFAKKLKWSLVKSSSYRAKIINSSQSHVEAEITKTPHPAKESNQFPDIKNVKVVAQLRRRIRCQYNCSLVVKFDVSFAPDLGTTNGLLAKLGVPRVLRVSINDNESVFQDVHVPRDGKKHTFSLSFTEGDKKVKSLSFAFGDEIGPIKISGIRLRKGSAERWIRYFTGGAVILNMAKDSRPKFDNERRIANRSSRADWEVCLDSAASSTGNFCRLNGTNTDWTGSGQTHKINNGERGIVKNGRAVCFNVPQMDALFVRTCD